MLKEVSGMEKKILLSSCETDYNSDLHSWIDIERQIKNLADAGFKIGRASCRERV